MGTFKARIQTVVIKLGCRTDESGSHSSSHLPLPLRACSAELVQMARFALPLRTTLKRSGLQALEARLPTP